MRVICPVATAPCRNRLRIRTIRQKRKDAATTETGRATVDSSKAPNAASWRRSGKIRPMPQMPGTAIRQNRAGQSVSTIFLSRGFTSGERVYSVRGDFVARRGTRSLVSYASARRPPQAWIGNAIPKIRWGLFRHRTNQGLARQHSHRKQIAYALARCFLSGSSGVFADLCQNTVPVLDAPPRDATAANCPLGCFRVSRIPPSGCGPKTLPVNRRT
jgi:hypothetical protein